MSEEPEGGVLDVFLTLGILFLILASVLYLFTGLAQPFVSVSSGSMEPHISEGDPILLKNEISETQISSKKYNIVTYNTGKRINYSKFGDYGDVIVFAPHGNKDKISVIHRPRFWVEEGENWVQKANKSYLPKPAFCSEIANCPAPHSGFITKGDANEYYDQAVNLSSPVKPNWIRGTATLKITNLTVFYLIFVAFTSIIVYNAVDYVVIVRHKIQTYISSKYN